ncbi:MAG: hypothetical protein JNL32_11635, partial [Candidatus Kapabacteria bacterium]|nr:hypothetical protein [Candidatus Kapabacteria bacterium]
ICGHEQVDFYACTAADAPKLRQSLRMFSDSLPQRIHRIVYDSTDLD